MNTATKTIATLPAPKKRGVELGCKYTGPAGFADTQNGVYWEVMPLMSGDELKMQRSLIAYERKHRLRQL